jgi:hypothetical protein
MLAVGDSTQTIADREVEDEVEELEYIADERALSERLGTTIEHPVRLFHLDGLGVSFGDLREQVLPSFRELPWDDYDVKMEQVGFLSACRPEHAALLGEFLPRYFTGEWDLDRVSEILAGLDADERGAFDVIRPYRRRALARFELRRARGSRWDIEQQPDAAFTQDGDKDDDYRRLQRRFAMSPAAVTEAPAYRAVLERLATIVNELHDGSITGLRIVCHQMGLVARPASKVTNSPEGIHQDGADYIVSALVLERAGVEGGESIVYGPDKRTEYLRHTLSEGEGIFQADAGSPLWHWVTPVHLSDRSRHGDGARNILGYDIKLV